MTKLRYYLIFSLIFLYWGCSQDSPKTKTSFKLALGQLVNTADSSGGLFLWGVQREGDLAFGQLVTQNDYEKELSNGTWDFYSIAWDGATPMTGNPRCAINKGNEIQGDNIDVSMELSQQNCSNEVFRDGDLDNGTNRLGNLAIDNCDDNVDISNHGAGSDDCDLGLRRGHANSFQVLLSSFEILNGQLSLDKSASLVSDCQAPQPTIAETNLFNAKIPTGNLGIPFFTTIRAHFGTADCGATPGKGHMDFNFPKGLGVTQGRIRSNIWPTPEYKNVVAFQTRIEDVCQGERLDINSGPHPFASGLGTENEPYLICTPEQFNQINQGYISQTFHDDSFKLLRSLDFSNHPFRPIGEDLTGAVTQDFSGSFWGNHKTIQNVEIEAFDVNKVGLIRSAVNQWIRNLTLNNINVECEDTDNSNDDCNGVGLLAGTLKSNLLDIKVHGFLSGLTNVGGVAGAANCKALSCRQIYSNVEVLTSRNKSGGIFGFLDSGELNNSASKVTMRTGDITITSSSGGLAGKALASASIKNSLSKGHIYATGSEVGGLVGTNQGTIENSYSTATVRGDSIVGGLVGLNSNNVNTSFAAFGDISGETNVGGAIGSNAGTCGDTFFTGIDAGCGAKLPFGPTNLYAQASYTNFNFGLEWEMPDEGHDIPRLPWETQQESHVPFLQRECSSNFTNSVGSGSASDPQWICSAQDFLDISTDMDNFYVLKRDIDFREIQTAPFNERIFPVSAAKIRLDGEFHKVANAEVLLDEDFGDARQGGLFSSLAGGTLIKNLVIENIDLELDGGSGNYENERFFGVLAGGAGLPAGEDVVIKDTRIQDSNILIKNFSTVSSPVPEDLKVGGVIGDNFKGNLTGIWSDTKIKIEDSQLGEYNEFSVGGIAGQNEGVISKTQSQGSITQSMTFTDLSFTIKPDSLFGGIVGRNLSSGIVRESSSRFEMKLDLNGITGPFPTSGKLGGLVGLNFGTVEDSIGKISYQDLSSEGDWSTAELAGLVSENQGFVESSYYQPFTNQHNVPGNIDGSGTIFTHNGISEALVCLAAQSYNRAGFPGTNPDPFENCLPDLNDNSPGFNFTLSGGQLSFTYDEDTDGDGITDMPDVPAAASIPAPDMDTQENSTSTWYLKYSDEPPVLRSLEQRNELFYFNHKPF